MGLAQPGGGCVSDSVVSPTPPSSPAERFAGVIDLLCRAVAARGGRDGLAGPLVVLIWSRLRRMAGRFARLAARTGAGVPPAASRRPATPRPARPPPPRLPPPRLPPPRLPPPRLPRGFAWLVRLVPATASGGSQLQYLLAEPEMAALLAAAPQAGRILRPLCRMLGVRPPPALLKPRPPARAPAAAPSCPTAPNRTPPAASSPATPPRRRRPAPTRAPPTGRGARGPPVPA